MTKETKTEDFHNHVIEHVAKLIIKKVKTCNHCFIKSNQSQKAHSFVTFVIFSFSPVSMLGLYHDDSDAISSCLSLHISLMPETAVGKTSGNEKAQVQWAKDLCKYIYSMSQVL